MVDPDELVAAVKEGKSWASHALVTTVAPVLLGYAGLVGGGLSSIEHELAVEAAIARGVRKIDKYNPARGSFARWLRPFVRHAIEDIRRRGLTTSLPDDYAAAPVEDEDAEDTTKQVERDAIRRAVSQLSAKDRVILHLRDDERLSYEQCAERIGGVTAGACRVRHFRALKRLADYARNEPDLAHYFEETRA